MGYESPNVTLIDGSGNILPVQNAVTIPASTPALLAAGSDGTASRFVAVDSSGRLVVVGAGTAGTPAGGVISIQGVASGTAIPVSGTVTATNASISTTGSAPPASATYIGGSVTTSAPSYTTGQMSALSLTTAGLLRVDGSGVTQPISGAITANIGTSGSLALDATLAKLTITQGIALGSNTQAMVGGSVTTSAPTYTTGNINPLSLDTSGNLRVTGSLIATDTTASGTLSALNNAVTIACVGQSYFGLHYTTTNFFGDIIAELSMDGGATWESAVIGFTAHGGVIGTNGIFLTGSPVTNTRGLIVSDAATHLRIRVDSYTSGSITVILNGAAHGLNLPLASVSTAIPFLTDNTLSNLSLTINGGLRVEPTILDNAVFTDGSTAVFPGGFILDETAGTTLTENDIAAARIDSKRAQVTVLEDATTRGQRASISSGGALKVDGSAVTQPVSIASAITANQGGTWTVSLGSTTPDLTHAGTLTMTSTSSNVLLSINGTGTAIVVITGSWTGTIIFEATLDSTTYFTINAIVLATGVISSTTTANGQWMVPCAGYAVVRARCSITGSSTAAVTWEASSATQAVSLGNPLPAGSNVIGAITQSGNFTVVQSTASSLNATIVGTTAAGSGASSGLITIQGNASGTPVPVSGTVTAANASVSTTGSAPPTSATYIGGSVSTAAPTYTNGQMSGLSLTTAGLLRTDGSGITQPVSGTVTANIGTSGSLALDTTLAKLTITQGTALGSNTQAMVGGSVTTGAPTYTTGNINPLSLTTAGALRIDGSGVTQPISGTVTANAGSGTFAVSGTVTANIGTSGSLALDATVAKLTISQGATLGSNSQALIGASVTTATPSYTTGQISPLSLTTSGQLRSLTDITTATGALGALNAAVTVSTAGQFGVGMQLTAGTLVGTILAEISFDNGVTWINTEFTDPTTDLNQIGIVFGSSNTVQTQSIILAPGTTNARVRVSAYTSGTANCAVSATTALTDTLDFSAATGSSNFPANIAYVGGGVTTSAPSYSTGTVNALSLNVAGGLRTDGSGVIQPITINDTIGTGSLGALNAAVTIACSGTNSYGFFYNTTNFNGTLIAEISLDGGTNWFTSVSLTSYQSGVVGTSIVLTGTSSSATRGIVTQYGTTNVRVRVSAYTSGTITIQMNGTTGVGPQLLMGAVQTSAPTYTTGTLNNISLDTTGNLRTVTNAGTGTFTTQDTSSLIDNATFTDGTSRVLPTGYILDETSGTALTENDVGAARMDSKRAQVHTLEDFNTRGSRLAISGSGSLRNTNETTLWHDTSVGSTVNAFWVQSTTTQTITNVSGTTRLNASSITTLNTFSIITSQRLFPIRNSKQPLFTRIRAAISANVVSNHSLVELGFGVASGVTAIVNNGAFFRWRADGTLAVVLSSNGSENVTQVLAQGVITANEANYDITIYNDFVHFIVSNASSPLTYLVDIKIAVPAASTGLAFTVAQTPIFIRNYVDATGGGTAIETFLGSTIVQLLDAQTNMSWEVQSAAMMRHASIDPFSYAQTGGSMTAAPGTITPSNTAAGTTTLGGDFAIAMTTASENPLSVFTYTIPSPYTFFLEGLIFSTPFVTTALSLTGAPILEWLVIANCASSNINTGGGQRFPIGLNMSTVIAPAIGTFWTINGNLIWKPQTPIACLPATVLHIGYKVFVTSAAGTPGVTRGSVFVDGFFM